MQAGLDLGLETGGTAAEGFMTEAGTAATWLRGCGLADLGMSYDERTKRNVRDSDATVVFGNLDSPGSRLTVGEAKRQRKPLITNPDPMELAEFVEEHGVETLNVAGNRETASPGITRQVIETVTAALSPTLPKIERAKAKV